MILNLKEIEKEIREEINDDNILSRLTKDREIEIPLLQGLFIKWTEYGFEARGEWKGEVIPYQQGKEIVRNAKGEVVKVSEKRIGQFRKEFVRRVREAQTEQYVKVAEIKYWDEGPNYYFDPKEIAGQVGGFGYTEIYIDKDLISCSWAYHDRQYFRKRIVSGKHWWGERSWWQSEKSRSVFLPLTPEDLEVWVKEEEEKIKNLKKMAKGVKGMIEWFYDHHFTPSYYKSSEEKEWADRWAERAAKRYLRGIEDNIDFVHHFFEELENDERGDAEKALKHLL